MRVNTIYEELNSKKPAILTYLEQHKTWDSILIENCRGSSSIDVVDATDKKMTRFKEIMKKQAGKCLKAKINFNLLVLRASIEFEIDEMGTVFAVHEPNYYSL
jgi:hypothetical protein